MYYYHGILISWSFHYYLFIRLSSSHANITDFQYLCIPQALALFAIELNSADKSWSVLVSTSLTSSLFKPSYNPKTMISSLVLSVLALIPFSVAQSSDPGLQIAAIEAHFSNAGLVPNLLSSFSPEAYLTVNFNGVGDVAPGTALTQDRELPKFISLSDV